MLKRFLLALAFLCAPGLAIIDRTPEAFDHANAFAASMRAGSGRALLGGGGPTHALKLENGNFILRESGGYIILEP